MANQLTEQITVEVAYATPDVQQILTVIVPKGSTIETAINRSGMIDLFPAIDLSREKVGIFSKIKKLSDIIQEGDRIEIYRALKVDPKERRRQKASIAKRK